MKTYVVYLRRSTTDENHQQYSLEAQEKICLQYAERNNLSIAKIIREKHSAKMAGKRPLFLEMLKDLREGKYAGAIVHNVDRLLRSIGDYALIDDLRSQHEFHFVDGSYPNTPEGNMMLGINVVFAKWYIEKLGKEVRKGFSESLAQGRLPRESPVGYKDMGKGIKEPDAIYGPLVRQAFELYATGDHSVDSLAEEMNRRGLRTKRGQKYRNPLGPSTMHRILSNPFFYGTVRHSGQEFQGKHQPLVSKELFDKVQMMLCSNCTSFVTRKPFVFRGMLRCVCGQLLSPYEKKGHVYYGCHNKQCPEATTREENIENDIAAILERISFTDEELERARVAIQKLEGFVTEQRDSSLRSLQERRKRLLAELDKARGFVMDGTFSQGDFEAEKQRVNTELENISVEEHRIQKMEVERLQQVYDFLEISRRASLYYKRGTIEQKRRIAQIIFLELKVKSRNLASYTLSEAFAPLEKRGVTPCGGADGI